MDCPFFFPLSSLLPLRKIQPVFHKMSSLSFVVGSFRSGYNVETVDGVCGESLSSFSSKVGLVALAAGRALQGCQSCPEPLASGHALPTPHDWWLYVGISLTISETWMTQLQSDTRLLSDFVHVHILRLFLLFPIIYKKDKYLNHLCMVKNPSCSDFFPASWNKSYAVNF